MSSKLVGELQGFPSTNQTQVLLLFCVGLGMYSDSQQGKFFANRATTPALQVQVSSSMENTLHHMSPVLIPYLLLRAKIALEELHAISVTTNNLGTRMIRK